MMLDLNGNHTISYLVKGRVHGHRHGVRSRSGGGGAGVDPPPRAAPPAEVEIIDVVVFLRRGDE